jgi:hypothetical protein
MLIGLLACAVVFGPIKASSQVAEVRNAVYSDVSIPLRDMKPVKRHFWEKWMRETEREIPNKFRKVSSESVMDNAVQQSYNNGTKTVATAPILNFNGLTDANNTGGRCTPPDPAGDVGPNHYVQAVNCMLQIFNKSGASLYGPVETSTIWNGFTGNWSGHNDGDAIILYDENADRWIISQFAIDCSGSPYTEYQMVAVSTTGDPTGSYYRYAFQFDYMPDYGKLGVWNDGYYMAANRFNTNSGSTPFIGVAAAVMERSKMLTGDASARMIYFKTETLGGSGSSAGDNCYSMLPSDCDGTFPVTGTPNYFAYIDPSAELRIWALYTDWVTTANSTFTYVTKLNVSAYNELGSVSQQGTSNTLDGLGDRLMFRNQYRNFGSYETFVTCHNVNAGSGVAGLRWYEYRKTGSTFSLYQQSTYAPGDGKSRWMGSIAMNASGDIGIAYSVSSSSMYPSIYFTGRKATDALNQLTIPEGIIQTGTNAMTGASRWGDYTTMSIDPSDNQTFWTAQEYVGTYGGSYPWATKIATFKFASTPIVTTLAATAVTGASATLNGTVNPSGFATNYHFEWGTTTSYGSNTTTVAAGSGNTAIAVNAPVSGLTGGVTYHFRLVGVNSEGTSYGNDLTFSPGAASVSTTAATAITTTTASTGGNVISDGGSAVTARGICWGVTANPTVTGSHTTDGSGLGVYTSSLSGLASSTTYHIRAYATNSSGTFYGDDLTFTTSCGIFTLPFSESFSNTTIPNCWTQVDNQGNGQVWLFGTIITQSPNPILTGNYAFLDSDTYGSGNSQNADLITPTIDLTGVTGVTLNFNHYFLSYSGSSGTVSYSINNGTSWTQIQQFTTTSATNPAAFNQVIAAVSNQPQVKFKWNYTGTYGYSWSVDDVSVTGTSSTLTVTPSNQNVTAPAGTTPFTVATSSAWTASANSAWCTVTPSGTGNGTLTATFNANTGAASRVANITVTVTGLTPVVVTVSQAGNSPTLSVTPSNQNVIAPAGNTSFTVTSNSAWISTSNQTWCTITPSGTGNGNIIATFTENTTLAQRVANITVTVAGITPVVVTVTQAAAESTLAVTPPNQNVTDVAGNTSFNVASNSSWNVTCNQTWCTVTPSGTGNGIITASYTANTLPSARIANITVTVAGITPIVVTVTQAAAASTLAVTPPNQNVTDVAGNTSFNVTSNGPWNVTCNQTWCMVTPSGTGNGIITASYTANTLPAARIAYVTVTVAGLTPVVVTVTQAAATVTLAVTPPNQNVSTPAGNTTFTITSNSAWTSVSDQGWCTVTPSGSGNGIITASYTQNTSLSSRIANITVTVTGLTPVVVTVSQAGISSTLLVTPPNQDVSDAAGNATYTVTSNSAWNVMSDQTWCSVTPSGTGNGIITAYYTQNSLFTERVANVTVTVAGLTPVVITLTQAGQVPTLTVAPPSQNVTYIAGSTAFTVTSNTSWNTASDQTWCTVNPSGTGNGTITAVYTENVLFSPRVALITVTAAGLTPEVVTVIQEAALPTLSVLPPNQDVATATGATTFIVASNSDWTVSSDQTWCTVFPSGTGNGTITAGYTENLNVAPRVAHITVTIGGLSPVIVTVTQADATPMLSVTPSYQDVPESAGSAEFAITSNTDWTAISDSAWCLVTAGGSGNGTIVANYAANPYHGPRAATITVSVAGLSVQTVTLRQATSTLSVEGYTANGIRLYPNPAKGAFSLVVDKSKYPSMEVSLIDLAGTTLLNCTCRGESEYHFDSSTLPQGCYFVKIKTASQMLIRKLVIIKAE